MLSHVQLTLLALAATTSFVATTLAEEPGAPITVMTYNIGGFAYIPLGQEQMGQIAQEIVDAGADIVGMTEVDVGTRNGNAPYMDMVAEISNELDDRDYYMDHFQTQTVWYMSGHGVIAIFSRYPIIDTGDAMTLNCYSTAWKVARATVEVAPGNLVHAFMTHYAFGLPPECPFHPPDIYQHQTDIIFDYVGQYAGPKILMGDFNFGTDSTPYAQYIAAGFQDSCTAVGQTDCLTRRAQFKCDTAVTPRRPDRLHLRLVRHSVHRNVCPLDDSLRPLPLGREFHRVGFHTDHRVHTLDRDPRNRRRPRCRRLQPVADQRRHRYAKLRYR